MAGLKRTIKRSYRSEPLGLLPAQQQATGHWRAINPGVMGFITVTSGASGLQVRAVRGPDLSDSQADGAGSIPVTRSCRVARHRGQMSLDIMDERAIFAAGSCGLGPG
jgi:hypothetical protein